MAQEVKAGGNGVIIGVGVVVLLGAAGVLLWQVNKKPDAPAKKDTAASASVSASTDRESDLTLPPIEPVKDTGVEDTAPAPSASASASGSAKLATGPAADNCLCKLMVPPSEELKAKVGAQAGAARICYNKAIEASEGLSGDMKVLVRVGLNGSVCSTSVTSDTTGSSKLQQCVKSRLMGSYPAPRSGCSEIVVPFNFKPKT